MPDFEVNTAVFDVEDERAARDIILTPEAGLSPDERWQRETEYLTPFLESLVPGPVLDIGCGIGRLSKVLIDRGATVVGVDQSQPMRHLARLHIRDEHFVACDWGQFPIAVAPFRPMSGAIAVWALQHIEAAMLRDVLRMVYDVLEPGALFLLVNRWNRAVPVKDAARAGWWDDGFDVPLTMLLYFDLVTHWLMPTDLCAEGAYVRFYRRKP